MEDDDPKKLSTKIQMLATLVATATYAAGFNPPGGVWQDIHDDATGHLPGDPMLRSTHYHRYAVFFYCNAVAFTLSLIIVVVTLFDKPNPTDTGGNPNPADGKKIEGMSVYRGFLMLAAMLAFTLAYGAGACRDKLTIVWYSVNVPFPFLAVITQARAGILRRREGLVPQRDFFQDPQAFPNKLMVPFSMFALTISYVAGLSTPGGFWDSAEGGHRPGDAILGDRLNGRPLKAFVMLNTMTFVASLSAVAITVISGTFPFDGLVLLLRFLLTSLYLLFGLLGAYLVGSSRVRGSFPWLLYGLVLAGIALYVLVRVAVMKSLHDNPRWKELAKQVSTWMQIESSDGGATGSSVKKGATGSKDEEERHRSDPSIAEDLRQFDEVISKHEEATRERRRRTLVQLMAGLAVAITYQAGLYPPGGIWPANADGHMAGDPILLTTKGRRYKGFYYCNSVSFVASMLAIFLAQKKALHRHHALEAAMILDMLGLIGAYAIGTCRDQVSTLYVVGIACAGVVYVVIHITYFTLGDTDKNTGAGGGVGGSGTEARAGAGDGGKNVQQDPNNDGGVENMGGRILLFAVLVASMTYQAGLTPPGGFLLKDDAQSGHHAGDPVLLYNYPRRYKAFFYCNSVSFMLSIVLILLLVNPNEYRPAIRSHALTVCSAVSYVCLMGAFAAGSTQHLSGSYFIFALAGLPSLSSGILLLLNCCKKGSDDEPSPSGSESSGSFVGYTEKERDPEYMRARARAQEVKEKDEKEQKWSKSVYLMTLAILVASVTYPAGLDPPGGSWQGSSDGHDAGNPVMHDSRRQRYLAFFIGNNASFFTSIMLILVLLVASVHQHRSDATHDHKTCRSCLFRKWVNGGLVSLQCLGFLVAYAAGSSRQWKTSAHIGTLLSAVLLFVAIHLILSGWDAWRKPAQENNQQGQGSDNGGQTEENNQQGQGSDNGGPQTAP